MLVLVRTVAAYLKPRRRKMAAVVLMTHRIMMTPRKTRMATSRKMQPAKMMRASLRRRQRTRPKV